MNEAGWVDVELKLSSDAGGRSFRGRCDSDRLGLAVAAAGARRCLLTIEIPSGVQCEGSVISP